MSLIYENETIVAIATPPGKSGVGIVRISGKDSLNIARLITKTNTKFTPNKMYLKTIYIDNFKDIAFVVYFKKPASYTGEDVVEIQAHGSYYLLQQIVNQVVIFGGRLATPGEFSKRAFLNGKMTIDQAEGVADIINAENKAEIKMATALREGTLTKYVDNLQNNLTDIIAKMETMLDYPEYEFSQQENSDVLTKLNVILKDLQDIYETRTKGVLIKNGVKVAIVGKPNVGKSSLLNYLCGEDKAIVTNVAGTTRDIVEGQFVYNGITFRLFDTAGIRESNDTIEKIGIKKTKELLKNSDLILNLKDVFDNSKDEIVFDGETPLLNIINKVDLDKNMKNDKQTLCISALQGTNIDLLKQAMFTAVINDGYSLDKLYLTNQRHIECVETALKCLENAIKNLGNITFDIILSDLKNAWQSLGEITGKTANELIIDRIFLKFCLGK